MTMPITDKDVIKGLLGVIDEDALKESMRDEGLLP